MKARHRNLGFLLIILGVQAWVVFQASWIHYNDDTASTAGSSGSSGSSGTSISIQTAPSIMDHQPPLLQPKRTTTSKRSNPHPQPSTQQQLQQPRLLVGIFSSIFYPMARVFRWRHRQLMQLYGANIHNNNNNNNNNNHDNTNTSSRGRICSIAQVHEDCQVIYVFVLGASSSLSAGEEAPAANTTTSSTGTTTATLSTQQLDPTLTSNQLAMSFDQWYAATMQTTTTTTTTKSANYDTDAFRDLIQTTSSSSTTSSVQDAIVLNITENMNQGKTPTFFHWAATWIQEHQDTVPVDYIVKCDADAMVRIPAMLQFVQKELVDTTSTTTTTTTTTKNVVPTMVGAFRHKALWNQSRLTHSHSYSHPESFWLQNYHHGTHLYMAGQWYLVSVDLAHAMVQEARRLQALATSPTAMYTLGNTYMEGHEDHDATSMIQVGAVSVPIRWISMPRHYRFWEHPVKGDMWWKRIWKREQRKQAKRLERDQNSSSTGEYGNGMVLGNEQTTNGSRHGHRPSLVVLLGATTVQERDDYRVLWEKTRHEQGDDTVRVCPLSSWVDDTKTQATSCDLVYVFVAGGGTAQDPTEGLRHVLATRGSDHEQEDTYLFPNIQDNVHHGMGTTVLTWLEESNWLDLFSFVVWVTAVHPHQDDKTETTTKTTSQRKSTLLHVSAWLSVESIHASDDHPHASLIGDLRDRYQEPLEFPDHNAKNDTYWWVEFENIHLYMGSDCWALGTSLVPGILTVARDNAEARAYGLGNLGHDLTTYAYFVPKTWLHWIPIPAPLRFWTTTTVGEEVAEKGGGRNQ